jgi:hypothetical protein
MKIGETTLSGVVEKLDRNFSIRIDTNLNTNGNYIINVDREIIYYMDGKKVNIGLPETKYTITKRLNDIVALSVTLPQELGGIALTGAQVACAIEMLTDLVVTQAKAAKTSSSSSSSAGTHS